MERSVLSADVAIDGKVEAMDSALAIEGKIIGDVIAKSVTVGPSGVVDGTIKAESVSIEGHLSGRVECQDLTVRESAHLRAKVCAGDYTFRRT